MNYLITGGTGFIGRFFIENLLARPGTIHVLVRESSRHKLDELKARFPVAAERIVAVIGDITRPGLGISDADGEALKGRIDHFFHFVDTGTLFTFLFLKDETMGFTNLCSNIRLNGLVRCREHLHAQQVLDDLIDLQPHTVGKIFDDDRGLDVNDLRIRSLFLGDSYWGNRLFLLLHKKRCWFRFLPEKRDRRQHASSGSRSRACIRFSTSFRLLLGLVVVVLENVQSLALALIQGLARRANLLRWHRGGCLLGNRPGTNRCKNASRLGRTNALFLHVILLNEGYDLLARLRGLLRIVRRRLHITGCG